MSISSEITRIQNKRDQSFTEVANKGVTVPAGSTIDDLPGLIAQIEQGSVSGTPAWVWEDTDGYLHLSYTYPGSESTLVSETLVFVADAAVVGTAIVGESRTG